MFEAKKYLNKKTLTKLRDSKIISNFSIALEGYTQRIVSNNQVVYRQLLPIIQIRVNHMTGDVEILRCTVLKNSYRIEAISLNGVVQRTR